MYVYLNDKLVPRSEAVVSIFDHGFLYGDGIYETMRVYGDVIFMFDEHLTRLRRSASMIGLTVPQDNDRIKSSIYDTLSANSLNNAYVRLTISRGYGPLGLDPDICKEPTFVIIAERMTDYPAEFYEKGIPLIVAATRRNPIDAINPQIKSLNFLNNILAKMEAKRQGAYEAIMLNVSGHIAEGTVSNVFFFRDEALCTPSLDCGILDGITRGVILDIAHKEGVAVKEGRFTAEDIYGASEVFITNTTMEVMPVSRVNEIVYKVGNVMKLLRSAYRREVEAYVKNVAGAEPSLWRYD
jgi:branched-chain amino acid aminotransferase